MKRTLFQKALLFVVVFILLMPMAMADMQRGDRSDDVQQLQELLFGTGWLFELPDGVFGRNTEQAVKDFENYADLPVDGVADDEMIRALIASWENLNGMKWTGYGASEEESNPIPPACCIVRYNGETSYTEYCDTHQPMEEYTLLMLESDDVESAKQASLTWQWEVERLYDRWIELLPEEEKGVVIANKATFFANIDAQRRIGAMGAQTSAKTIQTEVGVMKKLRSQVEWLCGVVWELENMNGYEGKPVRLNASTIIEGDTIYYSGSIDGVTEGVFAMDLNGGSVQQIAKGFSPTLEAVSNGTLFAYWYDWELEEDTALLIRADGTIKRLDQGNVEHYNGQAIAHDGYFYWNRYRIAEDGSEWMDVIMPTAENNEACYPVAVDGEYLYFMDNSKYNGSGVFFESDILPPSASLSRVKFGTGVVEELSGEGTHFIGIEDGMAYYTRQNFYTLDLEGNWFELETDQGLYCANLEVLAETQLSEIVPDEDVFDYYELIQNGIIYGLRADYTRRSDGWGDMSIIRMTAGGQMLAPIAVDSPNGLTAFGVVNGVHYGGYVEYMDSDYAESMDCIHMYNLKDGSWMTVGLDNNCSMFYGEFDPSIAVIDENIYYEAMDNDSYVVQLHKFNIEDGTDVVLAQGMVY